MNYSVVVVDDEKILLQGLINTYDWEATGFEVIGSSTNAETAFEVIKEKQPDLVVTDIKMKKMDGLELIEKVNALNLKTSFVVMSAYQDFEFAKKACDLGALNYLVKPFNDNEFIEVMKGAHKVVEDKKNKQLYGELLEKNKDAIIANRLRNYIIRSLDEKALIESIGELTDILDEDNQYCSICIDLGINDEQPFMLKRELQQLMIAEEISDRYPTIKLNLDNGRVLFIVYGNKGSLSISNIADYVRSCASEINEDENLFAYIGEVCDGIKGLKKTARQSLAGIEYSFVPEMPNILLYTDVEIKSGKFTQYPYVFQQRVFKAIMKNDMQALEDCISEFDSEINVISSETAFINFCYSRLAIGTHFF